MLAGTTHDLMWSGLCSSRSKGTMYKYEAFLEATQVKALGHNMRLHPNMKKTQVDRASNLFLGLHISLTSTGTPIVTTILLSIRFIASFKSRSPTMRCTSGTQVLFCSFSVLTCRPTPARRQFSLSAPEDPLKAKTVPRPLAGPI